MAGKLGAGAMGAFVVFDGPDLASTTVLRTERVGFTSAACAAPGFAVDPPSSPAAFGASVKRGASEGSVGSFT